MKDRMKYSILAAAVVAVSGGVWLWSGGAPPEGVKFAPTTLSPMGAYSYPSSTATPSAPTQEVAASVVDRLPAPLHPKAAEFAQLTAAGATPAMLSKAFVLASDCRRQTNALLVGVETSLQAAQRCQLEPGQPDAATMRRMLEARVQRNDFGAWIDVQRERTEAFADEPDRWRQLVAEAYRNGKEQGEPSVMAAEYQTEYERASALRAAGQATEAQAAYRQAAIYAVASAIGTAQESGKASTDVFNDKAVRQAMSEVSADQRLAIVNEGRAVAAKWRKS